MNGDVAKHPGSREVGHMNQTSGKATVRFSGCLCWNKQPAKRANKTEELGFSWLAVGRKPKIPGDSLTGGWI